MTRELPHRYGTVDQIRHWLEIDERQGEFRPEYPGEISDAMDARRALDDGESTVASGRAVYHVIPEKLSEHGDVAHQPW